MEEKKTFDYVGKKKIFFTISIALIVITALFAVIFGMQVDIEFKGGTILTYSYVGTVDTNVVKSTVEGFDTGIVTVTTGSAFNSDRETVQVSFSSSEGLTADVQTTITDALKEKLADNDLELINSQDVNPSIGGTFFAKCMVAVAFSFVLLVIYIALRFKKISGWSSGICAVIALLHDVCFVFAAFVFFRLPIDSNFMAVALTILGTSINNTIVIYDRIRENRALYGKKLTVKELVNKSISSTLMRNINTTTTTAASVLIIAVVALICGVDSIISFALPMFIGLIAGFYSSVFIAGPLWVLWQEAKEKRAEKKGPASAKKAKA